MFYSHQLLARKAPLGQIWMAATMHAKLNRKKLSKLNIIKICEEILNPSVPMALRLSGILMGGVVIVYQRKVKLLYDDVTRLLVEINEAWKVKATSDPTLLPKGKSQANYEAVTLPENREEDLGEIEQSLQYSNATTLMGFQKTAFISMRLDNVDEPYINPNCVEGQTTDYHQVDTANITLFENLESYQGGTGLHSHFERFDIEGDEEAQMNFTPQEHTEFPSTFIPSPPPPPQEEPLRRDGADRSMQRSALKQIELGEHKHAQDDEILEEYPADQVKQQSDEARDIAWHQQDQRRQGPARRKARKPALLAMDYEQTIIPGHIYQSWLQSSSDIVTRRGRKRKHLEPMSSLKMSYLMDLPPVVLNDGLFANGNREVYYPAPLLELWMRSVQPQLDSPSGRMSQPRPPEPSSTSPQENMGFAEAPGFNFEDFQSGVGSQSVGLSIEKQRTNLFDIKELPPDILMEEIGPNLMNVKAQLAEANGVSGTKANLFGTPGNSGDDVRSFPSSGSGHDFVSHNSEVHSGRSGKKRPYSASGHSGNGLEPVSEENPWHHPDPNFKLARLAENDLTPEKDLLIETGPTQTQQHAVVNQPTDHITDSIRMQLKAHFDTPGSPKVESLNQLAIGMNRKRAAHLFYQTCVLATRDFIKVEQRLPYGDILISRGAMM